MYTVPPHTEHIHCTSYMFRQSTAPPSPSSYCSCHNHNTAIAYPKIKCIRMTLIHNSLQFVGPPAPPPQCTVGTLHYKFIYNAFMMTDITILENVAQRHVCVCMYVCTRTYVHLPNLYYFAALCCWHTTSYTRGADKPLARPISRCILFDGENISSDASLVLYNIYIYIYIVLIFLQLWL